MLLYGFKYFVYANNRHIYIAVPLLFALGDFPRMPTVSASMDVPAL